MLLTLLDLRQVFVFALAHHSLTLMMFRRVVFIFLALLSFHSFVTAPPMVDCRFLGISFSLIFSLEWSASPANVPLTHYYLRAGEVNLFCT